MVARGPEGLELRPAGLYVATMHPDLQCTAVTLSSHGRCSSYRALWLETSGSCGLVAAARGRAARLELSCCCAEVVHDFDLPCRGGSW